MPPSAASHAKSARVSSRGAQNTSRRNSHASQTREAQPRAKPFERRRMMPMHAMTQEDKVSIVQVCWQRVMLNPMRSMSELAVFVLGTTIFLNALFFQSAQHPAPLFAPSLAPEAFSTKMPASHSVGSFETVAAQPTAAITLPKQEEKAPQPPQPPSVSSLRQDEKAPALAPAPATAEVAKAAPPPVDPRSLPDPDKTVLAVQRALLRLGYAPRDLRPDGIYGGSTRQAIEKFERRQGMPITGDITLRTTKLLSSQSGIYIP